MPALAKRKVPPLKAGERHAHGCERCGLRYQDACRTPLVNAVCGSCKSEGKFGRPLWDRDGDPIDCCYLESVLASEDVRSRFYLGGSNDWYKCRCSRTHPFKPTRSPS